MHSNKLNQRQEPLTFNDIASGITKAYDFIKQFNAKAAAFHESMQPIIKSVSIISFISSPENQNMIANLSAKLLVCIPAKNKLSIEELRSGRFSYKGRVLKGFTMGSRHGRLLALFLAQSDHSLTHTEIIEKIVGYSLEPRRDESYIVRDLKKHLLLNGLRIKLDNIHGRGYILQQIDEV